MIETNYKKISAKCDHGQRCIEVWQPLKLSILRFCSLWSKKSDLSVFKSLLHQTIPDNEENKLTALF